MADSRIKQLIDDMATTIVDNTTIEAVYSGLENKHDNAIYAEYGIAAIPPLNTDSNKVIDQTHTLVFLVWSHDYEDINLALEQIAILWYDADNLNSWQDAGGLKIKPIDIGYAIDSNIPSGSVGAIEFEFTMRSYYI